MKTSPYERPDYVECDEGLVEPERVTITKVEILHAERWDGDAESDSARNDFAAAAEEERLDEAIDWNVARASPSSEVSACKEPVSPNEPSQWKDSQASLASSEVVQEERWSDTLTSPPSSDISVARDACKERWSDCRSPPEDATDTERGQEPTSEMYYTASSEVSLVSDTEREVQGQGKLVLAGHVAAMRERFESMTRANTPCPDLARSVSPSLDVFRNVTPSPDRLG